MKQSESPFPPLWIGNSLENVGLGAVRPRQRTYGRYDFSLLPSPPTTLNGSFDWLFDEKLHDRNIADKKNEKVIKDLEATSLNRGLALPTAFLTFFRSRHLQRRIRSTTDCYLDLCPEAISIPGGKGYLVRFLADSQGCVYWYLHINRDGSDHAVVWSSYFIGTENECRERNGGKKKRFRELWFCAESFEIFHWRNWLENEIWLSEVYQTPMPKAGHAYIDQYLQNHTNSVENTDDRP